MAEIKLSREQRRGAIAAIQRYFEEERGESVGELAAMLFLDFLVEEIGRSSTTRASTTHRSCCAGNGAPSTTSSR